MWRAKNGRVPPVHGLFDLRAHFLYVEGYGEEGEVHGDLVFAEVPEVAVCHVELHLPKYGFRLDASPSPVPDPFL